MRVSGAGSLVGIAVALLTASLGGFGDGAAVGCAADNGVVYARTAAGVGAVRSFLSQIGLEEHAAALEARGYDSLYDMLHVTLDDLEADGDVTLRAHRRRIVTHAERERRRLQDGCDARQGALSALAASVAQTAAAAAAVGVQAVITAATTALWISAATTLAIGMVCACCVRVTRKEIADAGGYVGVMLWYYWKQGLVQRYLPEWVLERVSPLVEKLVQGEGGASADGKVEALAGAPRPST